MFKFKSLKTKLIVYVGLVVFISLSISIAISSIKSSSLAKEISFKQADEMAYRYGNSVKAQIEFSLDTARTLAQSLESIAISKNSNRYVVNNILLNLLGKNNEFFAVWTIWEPNAFDGKDAEFSNILPYSSDGRYVAYCYRSSSEVKFETITNFDSAEFYDAPKKTLAEVITKPYLYKLDGKDILMTSLVVPIIIDGKFVGVAGVDMALDTLQQMTNNIKPFDTGYCSLIENTGTYVSHADSTQIMKALVSDRNLTNIKHSILEGKDYSLIRNSLVINKEVYSVFVPVQFGDTKTPWSLNVNVPMDKILEKSNTIRNYSIIIGIVSLLIILLTLYMISNNIVNPIKNTIFMLKDIAEGEGNLTKRLNIRTSDEVEELANWFNVFITKIQTLVAQVKNNAFTLSEASSQISIVMNESGKDLENISTKISDLSNSFQHNASVVQQTTASIQEISSSTTIISSESNNAFNDSKKILGSTKLGASTLNEVVDVIQKIKISTDYISNTIIDLKDSSDQIGEIVAIISSISEQTNLLALNAAIEAARAGEQGRGFSVVAEEVRKLAEESKASTIKIVNLIETIQAKSKNADTAIKEGQQLVDFSVTKANDISEQFSNIHLSIQEITNKIEMMSDTSHQQSAISSDMAQAMDSLSSTTLESANEVDSINSIVEQQVSSFEEITANIDSLNTMSINLKEHTDKFVV